MAQTMRRDWPRNAGSRAGSPAGILNGIRRDRLPGLPAREQPLFWPCGFPVIAENVQQPGRKHNVTIFSPLARLHTDDHPLAVDSGWLEPDRLGNTQSRVLLPCSITIPGAVPMIPVAILIVAVPPEATPANDHAGTVVTRAIIARLIPGISRRGVSVVGIVRTGSIVLEVGRFQPALTLVRREFLHQ